MKFRLALFSLAALAAAAAVALAGPPQLQLVQELLPPDSGKLPPFTDSDGLKLRLTARFDCGVPEAEASLFVSVADTAVSSAAASSPQPIVLELPETQLRGVRESLACPGLGPHLMRAQLMAYATLICRSEDGAEASTTINRALDLWVECEEISTESSRELSEEALEAS